MRNNCKWVISSLVILALMLVLSSCGVFQDSTTDDVSSSSSMYETSLSTSPSSASSPRSISEQADSSLVYVEGYNIDYNGILGWVQGSDSQISLPFTSKELRYRHGFISAAQQTNIVAQINKIIDHYGTGEYPIPTGEGTDYFPFAFMWPAEASTNLTIKVENIKYFAADGMYPLGACFELDNDWIAIAIIDSAVVEVDEEIQDGDRAADDYWVCHDMRFYNLNTREYTPLVYKD